MLKGRPNKNGDERIDNRKSRQKTSAISLSYIRNGVQPKRELGEYGKEEFLRLTRALEGSKTITEIDLSALESACKYYDAHCQLEDNMLDVNFRFITTDKENMILSPWAIESKRCFEMYLKTVLQYGVTPLARARIVGSLGDKEKPKDPMEQLLKKLG